MDYILKPSLEHMALTKIAIALWNQDDVMATPTAKHAEPRPRDESEVWLKSEDKVMEKVSGLPLAEPLKKKLLKFISEISYEISKLREENFSKHLNKPSDLCWTPYGTVDIKKTAEAVVKNENIDVTRRYRLACEFCLEDDIHKLLKKIPNYLAEPADDYDYYGYQEYLELFWTYRIRGEMDKLYDVLEGIEETWERDELTPYQYAFEHAADCGHKAATEYFLQGLSHEEREDSLVRSAKVVAEKGSYHYPSCFPNVLFFLFSQMDEREQMEVLKSHHYEVLDCLLEWPWQSLFMETANRTWDFLSELPFRKLLSRIIDRVREGVFDYRRLFVEFWQQSPAALKISIIDKLKTGESYLLFGLFVYEDIENARLILNNATVEEKKEIIFSPNRNRICECLVLSDKWDSLKFFLQECLSSKEIMIEFKEEFEEHIVRKTSASPRNNAWLEYDWDKFFQLIDDLVQDNSNKRRAEEAVEST